MMTDPIADMLTRIRNANRIESPAVDMPFTKLKQHIAQVLKDEGFIAGYRVEPQKPQSTLVVELKYGEDGAFVVRKIVRVSKPGRRVYSGATGMRPLLRGMGIRVVSTPKGILSDRVARAQKLGGEILCEVN